jgi:MoaA/NifB/PqqE/SkfB family radical SAM enzyme
MDRPQKAMGLEIFRKIIDEAAALRIPNLAPNGFGEILTIRNLEEYLAYIRSKRHRFKILLNSNGYRMDIEKQELFLKYEVDFINITLDGATAETFESIRHKLKLAPIEANIRSLLALRQARGLDYPRVRVGMIAIPQNAHEGAMLIDKWKGVADLVGIGGFTNRGGSLDHRFTTPAGTAAGGACILPFKELNVWADGKAVLCCDDWNEEETVGDVRQNTLSEIWHGAGLRRARQAHLEGRGHEIAICSKCSMWRQGSHGARLWNA